MHAHRPFLTVAALVFVVACGDSDDSDVDSEASARAAYLGLDPSVGKAINLGFDGFNAASNANIPPQMTAGDLSGTLTVSGQVDAGASANKEMRLLLDLVDYRDDVPDTDLEIIYATDPAAQPALDLSLRNIPDGTLTGTLIGGYLMDGDLTGPVQLNLTIDGEIEPDPADADLVRRVPGSTSIVGTATSDFGTFQVNVTL